MLTFSLHVILALDFNELESVVAVFGLSLQYCYKLPDVFE